MAIQDFLTQSRQQRNPSLTPGVYQSTVVNITEDARYKDTALIITYCLQKNNSFFEFSERFIKNSRFSRTVDFYEYLVENSIESEEAFIGCSETLELKWNFTTTGKRELTITSREFVSHPETNRKTTAEQTSDTQC